MFYQVPRREEVIERMTMDLRPLWEIVAMTHCNLLYRNKNNLTSLDLECCGASHP